MNPSNKLTSTNSVNTLAPVIKQIDSIPKNLSTSERVVVYDRRNHRVLDRKPLIPGKIELYLVSIIETVRKDDIPVVVEDFNTNRKIGLLVSYRASCEEGNENRLVSSLCRDIPPGLDLDKRIKKWIFSLTKNRAGEFIDNFAAQLPQLKKELEYEAEELGLLLNIRLSLDESSMYYLVSNAKTTQNLADRKDLIIQVQDVSNSREIGVSINYQARLRDEKSRDKTIKALGNDYDTVADAVDERLREWTLDYIGSRSAQFIDNYANEIISLQHRLEAKAREDLNLILSTRIELDRNPVEYIIFNSRDISNIARRENLIVPIEDISGSRRINLSVTYQAGFEPTNRDKVARAFISSKSLKDEIDKKLKTWILQFVTTVTPERFIAQYSIQINSLQQDLQVRATEEVGLNLNLRLQLDQQSQLAPIKIGSAQTPTPFLVYVKDCDDELQLRVHTELNVDEDNIIDAVSRSLPYQELVIINFVKKKIKEYLLESVTINEFSYNLKTDVRERLVNHLNRLLQEYGRKVGFLSLDTDAISSIPKEIIEIHHKVKCEVQGYSEQITVDNTIQLLPQDLSMFRKMVPSGQTIGEVAPLEDWVKNKLDKIIKPLLLNQRYIEVLTGFQPTAEAIKKSMEVEAKSIGFSAEHIVSVPNLKHFELSREFPLEECAEGIEYLTNVSNVKVKLGTSITLKIRDFQKIEPYLAPDINVETVIQGAVRDTIREYINEIVPERYYMRFYQAGEGDNGKSIEKELKESIKKMLEGRFGAAVSSIVPRPIDTPIVKYYRELRGRVGTLQIEILPLSSGEPIKFHADFQVLGVEQNSWYTFQERMESMQISQETRRQELTRLREIYDREVKRIFSDDSQELNQMQLKIRIIEEELSGIDTIRRAIENSVQQRLRLLDERVTAYTDFLDLNIMQKAFNTWSNEGVKSQYGLEIRIENLRRDRTLEEIRNAEDTNLLNAAERALRMNNVDKAVARLEARKKQDKIDLEMLTSGSQAKSDELKQLREKRAKLIKNFTKSSDQEELDHLDAEIKRLEEDLPNSSLEGMKSLLQSVKSENAAPKVSFLDAMATAGLLESTPQTYESGNTDEPSENEDDSDRHK
jgi:hypothetical protein